MHVKWINSSKPTNDKNLTRNECRRMFLETFKIVTFISTYIL